MANRIEKADLQPGNFIDPTSRYNNSQLVYYGDKRFVTFATYKRRPVAATSDDRYYVITKATEYRPDLVSLRAYGDVSYWWKILEANNMMDVWEFVAGTNILIPGALI